MIDQIIYTRINNLRLFTQVKGQGKPLLFLHGWGASPVSYQKLVNALARHYLVYAPHLPCFGFSQSLKENVVLESYLSHVVELFRSYREEKFIAVGHSFGGAILAKLAVKFPDKFSSLYLADIAGLTFSPRTLREWLSRFKSHGRKNIKKIYNKGIFSAVIGDFLLTSLSLRKVYDLALMITKLDFKEVFTKIKVPTTVIWGEKDQTFPVLWGREIHTLIAGSTFHMVKNADHIWCVVHPEKLVKIIKNTELQSVAKQ